jgi:hypothetical protein
MMALEMACQELMETQEWLEANSQQNQQLQAQLSLLAVPDEGGGVNDVKNIEEMPQAHLTIPEDIDSPEVMVAFLSATVIQTEEEKAQLQGQVRKQIVLCGGLPQLAGLDPRSEGNCVCVWAESPGPTGAHGEAAGLFPGSLAGEAGVQEGVEGARTFLCPAVQRHEHHDRVHYPL